MTDASAPSPKPLTGRSWLRAVMLPLIAEKVLQHIAVTAAFIGDFGRIRASVALDYQIVMVAGAMSATLFALAGWALIRGKRWAIGLVLALALVDIVGEFVAQGVIAITITLSFVVALTLLILALLTLASARNRDSRRA